MKIHVLIAVALFTAGEARAVEGPRRPAMIRYAVIVGSNTGTDPDAGKLPDLRHAEREATELRDSLIKFANFDASPRRTVLLAGAKIDDVGKAIARIAAEVRADKQIFGDTQTLFAFFFTGHGLNGRLLLADGPIHGKKLAAMLDSIDADFTVGFFDACFSGSMTEYELSEKGVRPAPGLNLFRELPENVLSAEGTVWFVSSAPTEASYEDHELGGVFTHFFIQALEHAEPDGPGITLERIWSYARKETVLYTAARRRAQTPQEVVTRLKASAPLYFSFPRKRDAKLVMSAALTGKFLLNYEGGELSEILHKEPGTPLELDVYSGPARLIMIGGGPEREEESIYFAPGAITLMERSHERSSTTAVGEKIQTLFEKGLAGQDIRVLTIRRGEFLAVGAGYDHALARARLLAPKHGLRLGLRWDRDRLILSSRIGLGFGGETYEKLSYTLRATSIEARAGWAIELGSVRLGVLAGVEGSRLSQRYLSDGSERTEYSIAPNAGVEAIVSLGSRFAVALFTDGGVLFAPGAGEGVGMRASPFVKLGAMPMIIF